MNRTQLEISLSDQDLQFVRDKVEAGQFASASDVLHEAIESLRGEDSERQRWEREELLPAIAKFERDPSTALTCEQISERMQARRHAAQTGS